jgi:transcriptional regulator with XRE-family HTH domain
VKHTELRRSALQKPGVQAAYDALGAEFEILRQMLQARKDAGLSQAQVAERMGTKPPAVSRLESSLSSAKHSPSLATLRKYAAAVGCRLVVRLIDMDARPNNDIEPTR